MLFRIVLWREPVLPLILMAPSHLTIEAAWLLR